MNLFITSGFTAVHLRTFSGFRDFFLQTIIKDRSNHTGSSCILTRLSQASKLDHRAVQHATPVKELTTVPLNRYVCWRRFSSSIVRSVADSSSRFPRWRQCDVTTLFYIQDGSKRAWRTDIWWQHGRWELSSIPVCQLVCKLCMPSCVHTSNPIPACFAASLPG